GLLLLLGLLVLVLAVVHHLADRWEGARRDLDEIDAAFLGEAERFVGRQDPELLTLFPDHTDFGYSDSVVDAQAVALGTAAVITARTAVHGAKLTWIVSPLVGQELVPGIQAGVEVFPPLGI